MSGFEVAGIVLGAFPLAITALDKYREVATRLGLFYKIRLEYKKCRDALEFHQLTFTRHLRQLLLPLVVDDDRIAVLLADPGGDSWRDQAVAGLLRKRLQDSFALYVGYIEGMESVMKRVNRELAADSDAVQERVNAPVGRPSIEDLPLPVLTPHAEGAGQRIHPVRAQQANKDLSAVQAPVQQRGGGPQAPLRRAPGLQRQAREAAGLERRGHAPGPAADLGGPVRRRRRRHLPVLGPGEGRLQGAGRGVGLPLPAARGEAAAPAPHEQEARVPRHVHQAVLVDVGDSQGEDSRGP